jgi:hypothetical protein
LFKNLTTLLNDDVIDLIVHLFIDMRRCFICS